MIKQAGFFIQRFDGNFFIAWQYGAFNVKILFYFGMPNAITQHLNSLATI